jgi:hypothetical protein
MPKRNKETSEENAGDLQYIIRGMEWIWEHRSENDSVTQMIATNYVLDALREVQAGLPSALREQVQRILDLHGMCQWPWLRLRYFTKYEEEGRYIVCEYQDLDTWTSYRTVRGPFATVKEANEVEKELNVAQHQLDLTHGAWVQYPTEKNVEEAIPA